jgi:hypothetical protein
MPRLRSCSLEPNPTVIREEAHREEDNTRDNGKHNAKTKRNQKFGVRPLYLAMNQCLPAGVTFDGPSQKYKKMRSSKISPSPTKFTLGTTVSKE